CREREAVDRLEVGRIISGIMVWWLIIYSLFFFFQAEDGIRDGHVTGVQTCALPIWRGLRRRPVRDAVHALHLAGTPHAGGGPVRSEERRVGKECRSRWLLYH